MKFRLALLCGAMLLTPVAQAQNSNAQPNVEGRVKKLEKEMLAVQRQVFPNGAGKTIPPELTAPDPTKPAATGSNSAVSDLLTRVDSLETQLSQITGQMEIQAAEQNALEARIKALETAMKEQAKAAAAREEPPVKVAETTPAKTTAKTATTPAKTPTASAERRAAVAKVVKPKTSDAGEDSYMYGYNLWEAKFYPEAEKQLADTAAKYPKHKRASFARNLRGRAMLDDGRTAEAVEVLYDNYINHEDGERAPDSLYYVGVGLTRLGKTADACKTFKGLVEMYPDAAKGRLADELVEGRKAAKCK